ncbi:hypothetical protein sos41_30990 [Alphaproteobacteria bacterium SO-S41]|nr:hypothetical protein sos41_30990 [Alphaproteobacteria bacterium SO-S41]
MEVMVAFLNGFFDAFPAWVNAVLSVVVAASAVTALTPSGKDDRVIGRIRRVLEVLALNVGHARRSKQ